jgi:hypothetical protein
LSHVYWKPRVSHFWAGLMVTKKLFFSYRSFYIKDGSRIRSLEDIVA